ncbi:C2H2 transcription factor [Dichotomopilus funicola]|uniref:C2H2 transcription factor n=1 Tax=Dichotomopilus funicola TaxID=1934379 RepID=A0AAN6ZT64_9PEZI|nr:C2H2 transcription factor [Dichotomopilus funicola]
MAVGSLPTAPETWGRWPQPQHDGADFMMQNGMVPYDCRTTTAAHVPRPDMSHHFLPATFNPTPMPTPTSPQYHAPASYGVYDPYGAQPILEAPFKPQEALERLQPRCVVSESVVSREEGQDDVSGLPFAKRSCSPHVKSEAPSTLPNSPSPTATDSKPRAQATPVHQFHTAIDNVMRVIESKREILGPANEGAVVQMEEKEAIKEAQVPRTRGKAKRKRFCCDIPGCSKMFAQKNNLDTHRRSHTGESPYVCPYCQRRFTQSVNLKTHINRHTGERPYECPDCDKCFPQLSNVKAHMKTHVRRELRAVWAHQNTYHAEEIDAFNNKLASMKDESMISDEDKEMAKYLTEVHNLANKGIKGRGKGRKVKRVMLVHPPQQQSSPATSPISTSSENSASYPMSAIPHSFSHIQLAQQHHHQQQQQQQHYQHHQSTHSSLPYYGPSNPSAYSMSRGPNMLFGSLSINTRDPYHYGMDSDQLSDASSVHGSTPVMHTYEDEHGRELTFSERLY